MTVKSTCLNKYTDIHDYKTKSFLSLRMLVVFHSSHLLKFTAFYLHQILMEGEDETLCTHTGTFGGGDEEEEKVLEIDDDALLTFWTVVVRSRHS